MLIGSLYHESEVDVNVERTDAGAGIAPGAQVKKVFRLVRDGGRRRYWGCIDMADFSCIVRMISPIGWAAIGGAIMVAEAVLL